MLYPTLNEVTELLNEYKVTPVFCEVLSDTCTPIHIYNALESKEENCFMLESVDNSQQDVYKRQTVLCICLLS